MKRKTFVFSLFGISAILLAVGLFSIDIVTTKITMAIVPMLNFIATGYLISLIPIEHRMVDMNAEMKLTDITEVK